MNQTQTNEKMEMLRAKMRELEAEQAKMPQMTEAEEAQALEQARNTHAKGLLQDIADGTYLQKAEVSA